MRDALGRMGVAQELVDQVVLVVNELVTNAVLHAKCGPVITVHSDGTSVRLEVEDSSEIFPLLRNYGGDAVTGRGLAVVDASATWWGVDATESGKVVWAEFSPEARRAHEQPQWNAPLRKPGDPADQQMIAEEAEESVDVVFMAVPVDVYMVLEQHNEALLREFELLHIGVAKGDANSVPQSLLDLVSIVRPALSRQIASHRAGVHAAFATGQTHVNLRVSVSPDAATQSGIFVQMMSEAEELSRRGVLLTSPAPPEVIALRDWFIDELRGQVNQGRSPRPAPSFELSQHH